MSKKVEKRRCEKNRKKREETLTTTPRESQIMSAFVLKVPKIAGH